MSILWTYSAVALLDTAVKAPTPDGGTLGAHVDRVFIAPGPDYAKDCSLLAVRIGPVVPNYMVPPDVMGAPLCVMVNHLTLTVDYWDHCVPTFDETGQPPPDTAVNTWALDFYERADLLWQHIADATLDGCEMFSLLLTNLSPLLLSNGGLPLWLTQQAPWGDVSWCGGVTLGETEHHGPIGGMAGVSIPITVRLGA